jgi:hypothetical protein
MNGIEMKKIKIAFGLLLFSATGAHAQNWLTSGCIKVDRVVVKEHSAGMIVAYGLEKNGTRAQIAFFEKEAFSLAQASLSTSTVFCVFATMSPVIDASSSEVFRYELRKKFPSHPISNLILN